MGWLDLICVTTDPASTTFYGLAYAPDYSTDSDSKYVVLIRSNTNPISPDDLTWSIVSLIEGWKLAGYPYAPNGSEYTCSSNAQGVFTMFGRALSDSTSSIKKPYGIRYNPSGSMDDSFNYRRPGAWQNITVAGGYDWSGGFNRHSLGYVNNAATKVLVHASISDTNNTINLATVDDSTMSLYGIGLRVMNATIHGASVRALTIGNDHLYTYGDGNVPIAGGAFTINAYLAGFPLNTTIGSTTTPISKRYDTAWAQACVNSPTPLVYLLHDSLTLLCGQKRYTSDFSSMSMFLTIKDPNNSNGTGVATQFDADVINMDFFTFIGDGIGNSSSTFALLKKEGIMYGFGNSAGLRYTRTIDKVNVTETYGTNPNPPPPPAAPTPTILSKGGIVGIVFGAVTLAALAFFLGRRTSSRSKKNVADELAESDAEKYQPSQTLDDDKDDPQVQEPKDGANSYDLEGKYLVSSHPDRSRTSSTEILPMASIAPVPQYIQEQFQALHDQMRILQEQFYSSQFSNHPRPTYVTTASYVGEPAAAEPNDSKQQYAEVVTDDSAPGQPIQLTPPPRPVDSKGMPSPSAPAYANVVHQVQSFPQDSQSVAPQESFNSSEIEVPTPTPPSTAEFGLYPPQS
ncbi:hypothetical protein BKA57DRAFT_491808 [Linnemannia elongata]|nr:hypothetical protein BKA57DRAFT_491808 [Linnemannia elongata]